MRTWTIVLAALALVAAPSTARAQSESAYAGWAGLISTPVGGLPPAVVLPAEGAAGRVGIRARYGHWQFGPNDDNTTNLGIGFSFPAGESHATVEVGHTSKKGCSGCGAILVGAELHVPLATTPLSGTDAEDGPALGAAVEPAFGFMRETGSGLKGNAVSLAVSLPLSIAIPVGSQARLAPFVSPGAGLGHVSVGNYSKSGMRMMTGFGIAFVTGRLQVTGAARKIFVDGGATLYGLSVSVGG